MMRLSHILRYFCKEKFAFNHASVRSHLKLLRDVYRLLWYYGANRKKYILGVSRQKVICKQKREMVSFELGKERGKDVFCLVTSVGQRKKNPKVQDSIPHGDSELFLCPTLVTRRKNILLYFFTELKTYRLFFLFKNITLSTLLILAVCRTRVSVAQWQSIGARNPKV